MEAVLAVTESDREQSRVLINSVFPVHQYILRKDLELIPLHIRDIVLLGCDRDLIILRKGDEVVGTALLGMATGTAYISYLTKHPKLPKGSGKILMQFAEHRAHTVRRRQKMQVSTVYHPNQTQKELENWYLEQGYRYLTTEDPKPAQQLAWELQYREAAKFRYFEKNLGMY